MPRLVAALDADVLVPILSCDFLLTAFDLGLYEPVVSTQVMVEVERNLIADFPQLDPVSLRRRVGQMRDALENNLVDPGSIDDIPKAINPKDRHVIAAALAGEASFVVTNDKRLRTETETADVGLVAMSADDFAANLWELMPDDVDEVIKALIAKRTKRPITAEELMEACGAPSPPWPTPGRPFADDPVFQALSRFGEGSVGWKLIGSDDAFGGGDQGAQARRTADHDPQVRDVGGRRASDPSTTRSSAEVFSSTGSLASWVHSTRCSVRGAPTSRRSPQSSLRSPSRSTTSSLIDVSLSLSGAP